MFHRKPKPVTREEAERAAEVLGVKLEDRLTSAMIAAAFRGAVVRAHPDSGGTADEAADALAAAGKARRTLQRWIVELPDPDCSLCGGKGVVRSGTLTSKPCPRCQP